MLDLVTLEKLDLLRLLRQAQALELDAFATQAFAWLNGHLPFDTCAFITSFPDRPSYVDAHFHGYADPSAMLANWGPISHLDELSPRVLANPLHAQRQDIDDPAIAAEHYAPLRAHLQHFDVYYSACVAVPAKADVPGMTVFILSRGRNSTRYSDAELSRLEALAPYVSEALAICRGLTLLRNQQLGIDTMPVAIADLQGRLLHATGAFTQLFWHPGAQLHTTQLDQDCLDAMRAGTPWPLPQGGLCLHGMVNDSGWTLRLSPISPLNKLSMRERTVVQRYAAGLNRKAIARDLEMAESTVKNHLSHSFSKLGIQTRAELLALLKEDTAIH